MYNDQTVGVVVPAYNEEPFVARVIETLPAFVDRAYVVDDGSTDGTWAAIQAAATRVEDRRSEAARGDGGRLTTRELPARDSQFDRVVVPIRHEQNRGPGGAVKTGYRRARHDRVDVTAVIAADGQTEPELIERLVAPVAAGQADYAKGNRLGPGHREPMPRLRLFGNVLLTYLTRVASGYWTMSDSQNGSTAISLAALDGLDIDAIYDGYGWCNDVLVELNTNDVRLVDVDHAAVYADETSHIRFSTYVPSVSLLLLRGFLRRLRGKYLSPSVHPVAVCYLGGLLAAVAGGVAWLRDRRTGERTSAHLWGSVVGVAGVLLGMLLDAAANRSISPPRQGDDER